MNILNTKSLRLLLCLLFFFCCNAMFVQEGMAAVENNAYQFSFIKLHSDQPLPLKAFEGKVVMVVNTASQCGFTPQFASLEKLYQKYKDRGFVIIGVPSNDFGHQEPGSSQDIETFCRVNYGVTFPMTEKTVVSGTHAHPFYIWAYQILGLGTAPKWNFHKYLIDKHGKLVNYYYSMTSPDSSKISREIEKLLNES